MAKEKKKELTKEEKLEQALVPEEEWPYQVPGNWVWTRLEYLIEVSKERCEDFSGGEQKYIGLEHLQKDSGIIGYGNSKGIKSIKNVFYSGEILYGKLRPYLNKHDIASFDGVCSTDILVFRTTEITVAKFVNYFFDTDKFIGYAVSNSKGINLPRVSESVILDAIIPLPPLAEQQRIVDRIESLFAKLNQAKELAQNALDSFEIRKAAILHKAFIGKLTAKWREKNGVGMESWEEKRLGELLYPMVTKKPDKDNQSFRYIDIDAIDNETQSVREPKTMLVSEAPSRASRGVEAGNILFSLVRPYLKNIAYIGEELSDCIVSTGFYVCRCKPQLNSKFLYWLLCSQDTISYYTNYMKGDNSPSIRKEDFEGLIVNLPSLPEQKEIVRILDNLFEKEQKAKELYDVIEKIDLMKKAILARASRGELGTNDPNEESAVELLKKVLKDK